MEVATDNRVLVVLKPDCLQRNLKDLFIVSIINSGLSIEHAKTTKLDNHFLCIMYQELTHEHFYNDLAAFMKSGPCMILLVTGVDAIRRMNDLKRRLRKEHAENWIGLLPKDLDLWRANLHPNQNALNIKLVAANLIHICDSQEESDRCATLAFNI